MADIKKYKEYIFKDGDYREVVGSHTVSGGSGSAGNGDIEIELDFFQSDELPSEYSNENVLENDPRYLYLKITSTPITSEFEQAIKNGLGVIRFDYPIKLNNCNGNYKFGHKGFRRNFYTGSLAGVIPCDEQFKKGIIFLTEEDIKLNEAGEKIIYKKISVEELARRFIKFSTGSHERDFEDFNEEKLLQWREDGIGGTSAGISFYNHNYLYPAFKLLTKGNDTGYSSVIKQHIENESGTQSYNDFKKIMVFPMLIINHEGDQDFNESCLSNDTAFFYRSIYKIRRENRLSAAANYDHAFRIDALQYPNNYYKANDFGGGLMSRTNEFNMMAKPRLAILKSGYEDIGNTQETINNTMWQKAYKQCEQNFNLRFCGAIGDYDQLLGDESIIFIMKCQIGRK